MPYVVEFRGTKSYVGLTVSLSIHPFKLNKAHSFPASSVILMHSDTLLPSLTVDQRKVVKHMRKMLGA